MKILKNEKGSVTLFVLIAMLFFLMFMVGLYIMSANSESSQIAETARIKEIYEEGTNNIDDVYATLVDNAIKNPPENGQDIPSGTLVKMPENVDWDKEQVNAYSDGLGNTIPVPKGFEPIPLVENGIETGQGTMNTGFVIRDISTTKNEAGQTVPSDTNGNEFVWIPVEGISYNYTRYDFGKQEGNYSDYSEIMLEDEQTSVSKYGGYYIGRYEAGISKGNARTAKNENQTVEQIESISGKAIVQVGKEVYNYVTMDQANELAKNVYVGKSKLCSSYGWDTALKFMRRTRKHYNKKLSNQFYRWIL